MTVPGLDWLKDHLENTQRAAGGYQLQTPDIVAGAAAFVMSVLWVATWLVALLPLTLWSLVGWLRGRTKSEPD